MNAIHSARLSPDVTINVSLLFRSGCFAAGTGRAERLIFNQRSFSIRCPFARRVICAFHLVLSVIHI
jgi:hypothetical protein